MMTREDYLMAQAFVLAIEVLSMQSGEFRQDRNTHEMKDCLDRLSVPSDLIARFQSEAKKQIDRLGGVPGGVLKVRTTRFGRAMLP